MKRLLPILLLVFSVGVGAETIEYRDGTYTGELVNGVLHGQGTYTHADGEKYVGEWRDGNWHGQGTETWGTRKYIGEWRNGKRWNGATHGAASGTVLITSTDGVLAMAGSTVEIDLPDTEKNSLVQRNGSLKAGILVRFAWIYLIERRLELWTSPTMWPGGIKEIRNL